MAEIEKVKCLIIGSGPAGYTAAIYASRANLNPVLYTGIQMGGQLTTTTEVENFPGYPEGVTGPVMMEDMRKQAERFGTDIRFGIVSDVDFSGHPHKVTVDGEKVIEADAVIIATGATAKYLGLPSEEAFRGAGVSACATCDGFFYRKKVVAVVGGGDTACEEATYLAGLCRKVYLIVRKNYLRASKAMQARVFNTKNIEVLFEHNTLELLGSDMGVEGARLVYKKGTPEEATKEIKDQLALMQGEIDELKNKCTELEEKVDRTRMYSRNSSSWMNKGISSPRVSLARQMFPGYLLPVT